MDDEKSNKKKSCSIGIQGIEIYTEDDLLISLQSLVKIFSTSYGPHARLKIFQYPGECTPIVTSSSSVMLSHIKPELPLLDILFSSIKSHLKLFKDGGKFLMCLTGNIVCNQLRTSQSRVLCTRVNDHILSQILSWIETSEGNNALIMKLDFANISHLVACVTSVLNSRSLCSLSHDDLCHLSILIIRGFLQTISFSDESNYEERFQLVSLYGPPVSSSKLYHGLLIATTEMEQDKEYFDRRVGPYKVALFLESLTEESHGFDEKHVEKSSRSALSQGVLDFLFLLMEKLTSLGMNVLLNQKVVLPEIKRYLKNKGVIVIDRLGQAIIPAVIQLIQSQPVSMLESIGSADVFGTLTSIEIVEVHKKRYINLRGAEDDVKIRTLQLCSLNEIMLDELKICVESAQCFLYQAMRNPVVVSGAGCFETQLAQMLRTHAMKNSEDMGKRFHCSGADILAIVRAVITSFKQVSLSLSGEKHEVMLNRRTGHKWQHSLSDSSFSNQVDRCCCGSEDDAEIEAHLTSYFEDFDSILSLSLTNDPPATLTQNFATSNPLKQFPGVPDLLSCKKNALCAAFSLANVLLRVKYCLVDQS